MSALVWLRPPLPRFRIYSTLRQYASWIWATATDRFAPGDANAKLEQALCEMLGSPHAIAVNQARVGIYLAIKAVLSPERPRVIMSPYTIYDVVNMVIAAGGEPVFADIEPDSCNIDPEEVAELVDGRTGAVLVTHLHGLVADIEPIEALCRAKGVTLVEDCAQSFGVKRGGRYAGTIGDIGIYSFGLFKTINSFFGGVVVTKDEEAAAKIRQLQAAFAPLDRKRALKRMIQGVIFDTASFPLVFKGFTYWIFRHAVLTGNDQILKVTRSESDAVLRRELPIDYQQKMSNVQAQMILDKLSDIDEDQQMRVRIASLYHDALSGWPGIVMPKQHPAKGNGCSVYPIQVEDRDEVLRSLMREGRDCAPQHLHNCADLEIFRPWYRDCPQARATAQKVVLLPCYPRYGLREAQRNIRALQELFAA